MNKKPYNACKKCRFPGVITEYKGEYIIQCARKCEGSSRIKNKNLEVARRLWNKENE
jgi:hypothetical protein